MLQARALPLQSLRPRTHSTRTPNYRIRQRNVDHDIRRTGLKEQKRDLDFLRGLSGESRDKVLNVGSQKKTEPSENDLKVLVSDGFSIEKEPTSSIAIDPNAYKQMETTKPSVEELVALELGSIAVTSAQSMIDQTKLPPKTSSQTSNGTHQPTHRREILDNSERHMDLREIALPPIQPVLPPLKARWNLLRILLWACLGALLAYLYEKRRHILRNSRVIQAAIVIAADYKLVLMKEEGPERDVAMAACHQRCADRLLQLFRENRGIFIKAGQHMTAMTYLLPEQFTETMKVLHDQAPTVDYSRIEQAIKQELGAYPKEIFDSFDPVPVSSASLAQVHRAVYRGEQVAVKVQHPGLQDECWADVETVSLIIDIAAKIFPEFKLKWLIDEFNRNLPMELDFYSEALNTTKVRYNFRGDPNFHVPETVWELTTPKILTMEWIDGCKINDVKKIQEMNIDPKKVATKLAEIFYDQTYFHGYVHCDPHPGNIFLRKADAKDGFEIVLLDNGLYRTYTNETRLNYARLWLTILKGDERGLEEISRKLGVKNYRLFASMLTARIWNQNAKKVHVESKLSQEDIVEIQNTAQRVATEITDVLSLIPPELIILFKTNDLLRGILKDLGSSLDTVSVNLEFCMRAVNQDLIRRDPRLVTKWKAMTDLWTLQFKMFFYRAYLWFSSLFSSRDLLM